MSHYDSEGPEKLVDDVPNTQTKTYAIPENILQHLIFWSRRYCDNRCTYAPQTFNGVLGTILALYPNVPLEQDELCAYFPWAQDGMHDKYTGRLDARPANHEKIVVNIENKDQTL